MNPELKKQPRSFKPNAIRRSICRRCYGAGKDNIALLTQMTIAATKRPVAEDAALKLLAAAGGVKVLDKAIRGGVGGPETGDSEDPFANKTLRLMMAASLEKEAIKNRPSPGGKMEGVPERKGQATPRRETKKTVRKMK